MSKLATFAVAMAALVLAFVTLSRVPRKRDGVMDIGRPRRQRLCRTALGLVRPALSLWGAYAWGYPYGLLPLLARPLLARLVLSARAAKAPDEIAEGRSGQGAALGFLRALLDERPHERRSQPRFSANQLEP